MTGLNVFFSVDTEVHDSEEVLEDHPPAIPKSKTKGN